MVLNIRYVVGYQETGPKRHFIKVSMNSVNGPLSGKGEPATFISLYKLTNVVLAIRKLVLDP